MKKITAIMLLITAIVTLAACGGEAPKYKNDLPVADLAEKISEVLPSGEEIPAVPENYISNIMKIDMSNFDQAVVLKQMNGVVIDEYGIFKVKNADYVDSALAILNDYIELVKSEPTVPMYMPDEQPKLDAAEARAIGEYVIYCILSEDTKADVFAAISDILSE